MPFALRRKAPLVSFLLVMSGIQRLTQFQPGFDNDSMTFVVAFFVALYSGGRHATGIEAWLGVGGLVVTMVFFVKAKAGSRKSTSAISRSSSSSSALRGLRD